VAGTLFLLGLILLIVQLARPGGTPPQKQMPVAHAGPARPAPSKRSYSWVVVVVVCLLVLLICPVSLIGLAFVLFWARPSMVPQQNSMSLEPDIHEFGGTMEQVTREMQEDRNRMKAANNLREIGMAFANADGGSMIDGLNWFPEETTSCAVFSFQAA